MDLGGTLILQSKNGKQKQDLNPLSLCRFGIPKGHQEGNSIDNSFEILLALLVFEENKSNGDRKKGKVPLIYSEKSYILWNKNVQYLILL